MNIDKWNSETYSSITGKDICLIIKNTDKFIKYDTSGFLNYIRDNFDKNLSLQKVFYSILVEKDFHKICMHVELENLWNYTHRLFSLYKELNPDQYNNFGLPIDRSDMEKLVRSYWPSYQQMDLTIFKISGYYVGGFNDKWEWGSLDLLPTYELYLMYVYMKYDYHIIEKYNIDPSEMKDWFINTKSISLLKPEWMK